MDVNELNKWLETEEGKQWSDSLKSGLVNKRDELLQALKDANGKLAEMDQRSTAAEALIKEEQAALAAVLVDQGLAQLLKDAHVFDVAVPSSIATLKETYGIKVRADGLNRSAVGIIKGDDGKEIEKPLADIVSSWSKTQEAKQVIQNTNSGGGGHGGMVSIPQSNTGLKNLSGPALASLSDAEFTNMRNQALNGAGSA